MSDEREFLADFPTEFNNVLEWLIACLESGSAQDYTPILEGQVEVTDLWITVDQVLAFHGLKPQHLNIDKKDEDADEKLEDIIIPWIVQSQDLINAYTNRHYTRNTVRPAVKNVCLRLVSNMISLAVQKRDSPIIKVNDWSIQNVPSDIFTQELKEDLRPFVKDSSTEPNSIGVYAITGSDE